MQPAAGARPDFADEKFIKSYYYSLESTYRWLKEEKTYANCRGPGFVECYDRYDEKTSSQWGVTGLAVIVPKTAAPGKPWVFRADAITRDAVIDLALLASGFHIVIPPLTAQSGAVRTHWNAAYKLMTDHGFSKKPVMEGTGRRRAKPTPGPSKTRTRWPASTDEIPRCAASCRKHRRSKISRRWPKPACRSCTFAARPTRGSTIKRKVVEKRYKELGGQITVIINENDAHYPLAAADQTRVVDFIVGKAK